MDNCIMKLLFLMLVFAIGRADDLVTTKVTIDQGTLEGFREESLNGKEFFSFLGIPFAKPPIGILRLKDPEPAGPWTGVYNATVESSICPQYDMMEMMKFQYVMTGDEDCLYLNVYTKKPNKLKANVPVMVFLHGGAYMLGSAQEYKPYVFLNENVIFVTVQYRIGPLGFLSTEDDILPGNYGLKDQVMALKWVQKNIHHFGGDPGRVTIFGASSGAGSAHLLMLSPWSKGLFNGVISQSGNGICSLSLTREAKKTARDLGSALNCPIDDSEKFLECIRTKEPGEILDGYSSQAVWGCTPLKLMPVVDGDFIPDEPIRLLKEGRYNKVNFIAGTNRNEGIMTSAMKGELLEKMLEDFDRIAPLSLTLHENENSAEIAKRAFEHYLEGKELKEETFITLEPMFTDRHFSVCHEIATEFHSQDPELNTYRYQLDWRGQHSLLNMLNITMNENDVCHGDDLFYMFSGGSLFQAPLEVEDDLKLREIFIKLWTNFAATGNPTPDDSLGFTWDPAKPSNFRTLRLTPQPYMSDYVNTKGRDFWGSLPLVENAILKEVSPKAKEEL